jgi:coenzyme F420-dependent glucose-6-phosphate dehydrogenase
MVKYGYLASLEQYSPTQLLDRAVLAEKYGFDTVVASDHFYPWSGTDTPCSFAWVWLAAAAERTKKAVIGSEVTSPILRYNPAIVAQAFATLAILYPNRVSIAVGTGEALNEVPVGYDWPPFKERVERLEEAISVMKLLWRSDKAISFKGEYYRLNKAKLYTKPRNRIPLYVAANGPTVAQIAGKHADGLLTVAASPDHYRDTLFPAFEKSVNAAGKDLRSMQKIVEITVSYDEDYDKALQSCRYWKACQIPAVFKYAIYDPKEIEEYGKLVGDELIAKNFIVATTPEEHIKKIENYIKLGFTQVIIMSSSPNEENCVRMYGENVLPYLRETYNE